ncbi:MAG: hypothetical protein ACI9MR_004401, partial [Myxococcota bacterium]
HRGAHLTVGSPPAALAGLGTLEELVRWLSANHAGTVVEVIYQDEFNADVVVVNDAGTYWVFDTT